MLAAMYDLVESARMLVDAGADISIKSNSGETAIQLARKYSSIEAMLSRS